MKTLELRYAMIQICTDINLRISSSERKFLIK